MLVALESRCASCTIVCQGAVSLLENRSKEPEVWGSVWIQPHHPPKPFPPARQRKPVLRAAEDGPLPPLGFSFSFFALFRYVKIRLGGKLGLCGAGAVQSHGSWCGAVLPAWGHLACLLLSPFGQRCWDASLQQVQPCRSPRAMEHPWLHASSSLCVSRGGKRPDPGAAVGLHSLLICLCEVSGALAAGIWPSPCASLPASP